MLEELETLRKNKVWELATLQTTLKQNAEVED
jgi:hypothetical protein